MFRTQIIRLLLKALLALGALCLAQTVPAQTISNTAQASWSVGGSSYSVRSNTVSIDLAGAPITLDLLKTGTGGAPAVGPTMCGGHTLQLPGGLATSGTAGLIDAVNITVGSTLYLRVTDAAADLDHSRVDTIDIVITTDAGDRETLTLGETGVSTGVFVGGVPTAAAPMPPVIGDCSLSVAKGNTISVTYRRADGSAPAVLSTLDVLADPFGFVFDSEDGSPVDGVRITLVDAATGAPATVFADDGVTRYPSTFVTGQPAIDASGVSHALPAGEYRFPLAPLGQYRLVIEPPGSYRAPSTATAAQLAPILRPDGQAVLISQASYGGTLALAGMAPVRVDVPLDRPATTVVLSKSASRNSAAPGDAVFYTITLSNPDPLHAKRDVAIVDSPSPWLRVRPDSIQFNGASSPQQFHLSNDGKTISFEIAQLAPGQTVRITYAMTVRADAPPGQAVNSALATDSRGNQARASAMVRIEREAIADRMTLIGRITAGGCETAQGVPGVRVMLEDGSYAITDEDGRYHFEGLTPGSHVAQALSQTLPGGAQFVDCARSTRSAGSASSRFLIGQGGNLLVADFATTVPVRAIQPIAADAAPAKVDDGRAAAGGDTDWLAAGNGPIDWLFPAIDYNPRAPALRVVIRHRPGQTVTLSIDGHPVDALAFDGARTSSDGTYAVSIWRGIPLLADLTRLTAVVRNADGTIAANLNRDVHFVSVPARAEIVSAASHLIADGASRPVIAVRILGRDGLPVHAGISGQFSVNSPYESGQAIDAAQSRALAGQEGSAPTWTVKGDDGIAMIELAPTMVSGALRLEFVFADQQSTRRQTLEGWLVPGNQKWTLVGLAEGSIGARSVADNMDRTGRFDSDLGDNARIALYAKGRVLGRYLLTASYDSAKQPDDQRLLGAIDPNAYYTVFADRSVRRFDAASRSKLYVRVETSTFYAMFGDISTGFDQTQLGRYQRTATGVKAEAQIGAVHVQGFAAKIASTHRRDELQGAGISGPYRLSSRAIIANSEVVSIEVRDRFRSEQVVTRHTLTRFIDYNVDLLSGTISFKAPVLSRDSAFNPQFIVIDYEIDELAGGSLNAGLRTDWTSASGKLRIGATAITDRDDGPRTNLAALDLKAKLGEHTELRAETAASRSDGTTAFAWLFEIEHHDGNLDVLGYARSTDPEFGLGQTNGVEQGRRKIGADVRYHLSDTWSVSGSAWHDESLVDPSRRTAVQVRSDFRRGNSEARLAMTAFRDRLNDGRPASSTVIEAGTTQRLFDSRLELDLATSFALGQTNSADLPTRHRLTARYALKPSIKLIGSYEIAEGDAVRARTARGGIEVMPWRGARATGVIGQQSINEYGQRAFATFGLAQSFDVTSHLSVDATIESNRTLGGFNAARLVNPLHPAASGGQLSDNGAVTEDFTAATLGAAWRAGQWSATIRGEVRDGQLANRKGITFGAIRQLGEGSTVGAGFNWTRATAIGGATTEVLDSSVAAAYRPATSTFSFLTKLEYRSDMVAGAVLGEAGPAGRTALVVSGDARSRRLIGSFSANWSPRGHDDACLAYQRSELGLFLGVRHNFDSYEGFDLAGTTLLGGLDARLGLGEKFEVGIVGTVRSNRSDHTTSFAIGPQIGFNPQPDMLFTIGYNITGFRDRDFSAARSTDKGLFATVRMKFDASSFDFLGLHR